MLPFAVVLAFFYAPNGDTGLYGTLPATSSPGISAPPQSVQGGGETANRFQWGVAPAVATYCSYQVRDSLVLLLHGK